MIKEIHEARLDYKLGNDAFERRKFNNAWQCVSDLLPKCERTIEDLLRLLKEIQDAHVPRVAEKFQGFLKEIKRRARDADFLSLSRDLTNYNNTIQLLLLAIQTLSIWESRSSQEELADDAREEFLQLHRKIDECQSLLESEVGAKLRGAFDAAKAVAALGSNTKYFDIPQSVSSIFTGQEELLDQLASLMFSPTPVTLDLKHEPGRAQKRFVIYGLGGSGKTQFCCKFAQDNRQRFETCIQQL